LLPPLRCTFSLGLSHNLEENFWTLADPAGNEVDVATTSAPDLAE
jgi:hypothetical protein